jgi:DNA replication and repair protein RecF
MSELDSERRELLASLLRAGGQAVVTTTEPEHVPGVSDEEVIRVQDGRIAAPAPAPTAARQARLPA